MKGRRRPASRPAPRALAASKAGLAVQGAVAGTGSASVNGARLDFTASFNENVAFSGKTGGLAPRPGPAHLYLMTALAAPRLEIA